MVIHLIHSQHQQISEICYVIVPEWQCSLHSVRCVLSLYSQSLQYPRTSALLKGVSVDSSSLKFVSLALFLSHLILIPKISILVIMNFYLKSVRNSDLQSRQLTHRDNNSGSEKTCSSNLNNCPPVSTRRTSFFDFNYGTQ